MSVFFLSFPLLGHQAKLDNSTVYVNIRHTKCLLWWWIWTLVLLVSAFCELVMVSYGLKTSSKLLHMLSQLLGLFVISFRLSTYMYSQATSRLLNACVPDCNELASSQQWAFSKQKFEYSFLYSLGLEDQFSAKEDIDTLWIAAAW